MDIFNKIPNRLRLLVIMLLLYLLAVIFKFAYVETALINTAKELLSILPIFILVFGVNFVVNIYIKPDTIKKHLGHDSGLKGWLYSVPGAMVMVCPPYILFPLLGELKKHGMKNSLLASFLNNRSVQPIFMPVMAHYFGLTFTVILFALTFVFSFPSALLIERALKQ